MRWTSEAEIWLREVHDYIAQDNADAARRTVDGIYRKTEMLAAHPEIGYLYGTATEPVRILLFGHYRIAYRIKPDHDIDVIGVFPGALDITRYLG